MPLKLASPPLKEDVLDRQRAKEGFRFTASWERWWQLLVDAVTARPQIIASASTTGQTTAIGATALQTAEVLPNGLYRVSGYIFPTRGVVHSAYADIVITWTSGGITFSKTLTGLEVAATVPSGDSGFVLLRADQGSTVYWSTTYATGAFPAQRFTYSMDVVMERLL